MCGRAGSGCNVYHELSILVNGWYSPLEAVTTFAIVPLITVLSTGEPETTFVLRRRASFATSKLINSWGIRICKLGWNASAEGDDLWLPPMVAEESL